MNAEDERQRLLYKIQRRRLCDSHNSMELPDNGFIANFRLNKARACSTQVLEELRVHVPAVRRKTAVPNELKVSIPCTLI